MAQFQVFPHAWSSQVKIAVFHANIVTAIGVIFDGKRRSGTLAEHIEFCNEYLDVASGQIGILALPFAHFTLNLHTVFTAKLVGCGAKFCIAFFIEHKLCDTITVAEVNKCHTSHLAAALHPSCQGDLRTYIRESQLSACICSIHNLYL